MLKLVQRSKRRWGAKNREARTSTNECKLIDLFVGWKSPDNLNSIWRRILFIHFDRLTKSIAIFINDSIKKVSLKKEFFKSWSSEIGIYKIFWMMKTDLDRDAQCVWWHFTRIGILLITFWWPCVHAININQKHFRGHLFLPQLFCCF